MISFTVDSSKFQEWVEITLNNFPLMVQTMIDVATLIESNTQWRVPLETGRLEQSFKYVVTEKTSDFVEVELGYDATDPRDNYMYAEYQHEHRLRHPIRGEAFYLFKGIKSSIGEAFEMIEKDYLSLFGGKYL